MNTEKRKQRYNNPTWIQQKVITLFPCVSYYPTLFQTGFQLIACGIRNATMLIHPKILHEKYNTMGQNRITSAHAAHKKCVCAGVCVQKNQFCGY